MDPDAVRLLLRFCNVILAWLLSGSASTVLSREDWNDAMSLRSDIKDSLR